MTTITIPRALLEQALSALTYKGHFPWADKEHFIDALRAELAKPARCALCGYQHGHQIGCANNPVDIALAAQAERLQAELAKPVQKVEPFAYTTGMYCGRFTVEPVNRATVIPEGLAFYLHPPTPAWHDAPTEPGWWVRTHDGAIVGTHWITDSVIPILNGSGSRWYGPIPQDGGKS